MLFGARARAASNLNAVKFNDSELASNSNQNQSEYSSLSGATPRTPLLNADAQIERIDRINLGPVPAMTACEYLISSRAQNHKPISYVINGSGFREAFGSHKSHQMLP